MIVKGPEAFPNLLQEGLGTSPVDALRTEAELANLPPALVRMNTLLGTTPVDLRGLGEAIKEAPDLASEAVRFCNSSLFALPQPVASLEQAVLLMDADIVRSLLLTCWLTKHTRSTVPSGDNQMFWSHCLLAAQLSRHISEWACYTQPEWAFLAGLFHDIGMLPLLSLLGRHEASLRAWKDLPAESDHDAEKLTDAIEPQRRRFGTDHCELGLQMSSILGLPDPLIEVVARHHQRGSTLSRTPLVSFVAAAEVIAQTVPGRGDSSLPAREQVVRNALTEFLPGLGPAARAGLARTLEADLSGAAHPKEINVWDDPLGGDEAQPRGVSGSQR